MDGNIGLKRQVSDFELTAIRVGVGVAATVLIYVLSVAWACGGRGVASIILSQFKSDALYYCFFIFRYSAQIFSYSTTLWGFFFGGVDCDQILCRGTPRVKRTQTGL